MSRRKVKKVKKIKEEDYDDETITNLKEDLKEMREEHSKLDICYNYITENSESKKEEIKKLHEQLVKEQLKLQEILNKERKEKEDMKTISSLENTLKQFNNKVHFWCNNNEYPSKWVYVSKKEEIESVMKTQYINKTNEQVNIPYLLREEDNIICLNKQFSRTDSCKWSSEVCERVRNTVLIRHFRERIIILEYQLQNTIKSIINNINRIDNRVNEVEKKIEKAILLNNEKIAEVFGEHFQELEKKIYIKVDQLKGYI
tara:strand:- start:252 stop:1025 length:774 start_codon:yes stop_codon:yes gene_type:complete